MRSRIGTAGDAVSQESVPDRVSGGIETHHCVDEGAARLDVDQRSGQ
jgi:hypothetical protein